MNIFARLRFFSKLVCALGAVAVFSACAAEYKNHGYIPPQEDLAQITVGVDTRATVEETIGVPASAGLVNDTGLYYVRSRVKTVAMFAPKVIERQVLAVSFDTRGVVSNVELFGLERGKVVPLSRRVTTPGVSDNTFLRQLLGNIGRFNPAGLGG
ncbi:MAG: outer membrane protein assembly factor BamE [Sulfitobacter sp.]